MDEHSEITDEELAAVEQAAMESGLVEGWEYYAVYRKRGQKNLTVNGPHNWPFGLRKDGKLIRRKKVTSYGTYEVVSYDENGDAIEDTVAHAFARWLVSLDDPENQDERARVTLDDIIAKAKSVSD